jgi:hypothetical protein
VRPVHRASLAAALAALVLLPAIPLMVLAPPPLPLRAPEAPAAATAPPEVFALPPNVRVTSANGPANEVHIAVNPLDPLNLIAGAKDYTLGNGAPCGEPGGTGVHNVWAGYYWSRDGGQTWGNGLMPGYPGAPPLSATSLLTGYKCSSDPVVAFDNLGHAHYLGLAYNAIAPVPPTAAPNMAWMATSVDGGATWPVMTKIGETLYPALFDDKEWFAFDPLSGTAFVTWTEFTQVSTNIMVVRCPLALACTPLQPLTLPGVNSVQGSAVAVGPDGVVHLIWLDYGSRTVRHTSALGGVGFLPDEAIATFRGVGNQPNSAFRTPTMPALAVDPVSGALYAVWTDRGLDTADVYGTRSTDGGVTWSAVFRVNDDAAGKSNFFPAVSVAPNGRVDVAFYDRRDDPANKLLTTYLATSTDGGVTWVNSRVGDTLFNGDLGYHQAGAPFIGDYIGVASTDDHAYPLWADTRDGTSQVYVGLVPR